MQERCLLLTLLLAVAGRGFVPESGSGEAPAPSSCPQCLTIGDAQKAAQIKVEAIKGQILSKLSLHAKPNISSPLPREAVLEILRRSPNYLSNSFMEQGAEFVGDDGSEGAPDDYYARTSEIMAFAEPGSTINGHVLLDLRHPHEHPQRLRVTSATLWLQLRYVTALPPHIKNALRNRTVNLFVFRATANQSSPSTATLSSTTAYSSTSSSQSPFHFELLVSQKVSVAHVGWTKINMLGAIQTWFEGSTPKNLTLLVDCNGCDGLVELSLFGKEPGRRFRHKNRSQFHQDFRPFLSITTDSVHRRRSRRYIITCNSVTNTCCKKSLYVSFKELGWDDWIIAPKGYYANYCMGDCVRAPRTPDTFAHFHTHVIEEYRSRNPYASIAPCCAPTRLSPMSLIYFDTELNIIKTDLPKMIVEECGCT